MKNKKILIAACALSLIAVGTIGVAGMKNNIFTKTSGEEHLYTLSINKNTGKQNGYFGYYVATENGNKIYISNFDAEGDAIYELASNGEGVFIYGSIQGITSVSVTYQLPTNTCQTHGGYLNLYVGDSDPAYNATYHEDLALINNNGDMQTQTLNITDPSQCHYVTLWYAIPSTFDDGNALIYSIDITYSCY